MTPSERKDENIDPDIFFDKLSVDRSTKKMKDGNNKKFWLARLQKVSLKTFK